MQQKTSAYNEKRGILIKWIQSCKHLKPKFIKDIRLVLFRYYRWARYSDKQRKGLQVPYMIASVIAIWATLHLQTRNSTDLVIDLSQSLEWEYQVGCHIWDEEIEYTSLLE